jgi:hypothetical protein
VGNSLGFLIASKLTAWSFFDRPKFSITLKKPPSYISPWIVNPRQPRNLDALIVISLFMGKRLSGAISS